MTIRNINDSFGDSVTFATTDEMAAAITECGYAVPVDGLVDGRDYETVGELPDDAVIVETMPEHLRGSHEAAGNWGSYPHNGAERTIMSRAEAEELVDGDDYNHIVRDAKPEDASRYEIAR